MSQRSQLPIVHIGVRGGTIESVDCDQDITVIVTDLDNHTQRDGKMFEEFAAEKVTRKLLAESLRMARSRKDRGSDV